MASLNKVLWISSSLVFAFSLVFALSEAAYCGSRTQSPPTCNDSSFTPELETRKARVDAPDNIRKAQRDGSRNATGGVRYVIISGIIDEKQIELQFTR